MDTIFTKIRKGEIPGFIFDDNGEFFVIHTNNPIQLGHLLVIPYQEIDYIFDLDDHIYNKLWLYVKKVSLKLQKITNAKKIAIKVEGLEVNHIHIHLIPINNSGDMLVHTNVIEQEILDLQNKFNN
ncbi:HIT family protein [bacterium]|nr:HIT family protein [Candidatus Elulimicrobium humile]